MKENVAPQAQILELQMPQTVKETWPLQNISESQEPQKPLENLDLPQAWKYQELTEVEDPQNPRDFQTGSPHQPRSTRKCQLSKRPRSP